MADVPGLPTGGEESRHASHYAAAIYGSIVATAIIGALRNEEVPAGTLLVEVLGTMVVFWIAHTWAAIAGERIQLGHGLLWHRMTALGREEWPMVEAGFGPVLALALGWLGVIDNDAATALALAIGVVQLFAWGFVLGRRVYGRWTPALLAAAGNGVLGLVLVGLEIAITH